MTILENTLLTLTTCSDKSGLHIVTSSLDNFQVLMKSVRSLEEAVVGGRLEYSGVSNTNALHSQN